MPIVAAAVVPHSPLILPTVSGQHAGLFRLTRQAMTEVVAEFYARKVETILIFTPHGPVVGQAATLNVAESYTGQLIDFGDAQTKIQVAGDVRLAQTLHYQAERSGLYLVMHTAAALDYGTTVPLSFFLPALPTVRVLPLTIGPWPVDQLSQIARVIEEYGHQQSDRIGLLASADLVRRSKVHRGDSTTRPLPLERTIGQAIGVVNPGPVLTTYDPALTCGLPPVITLLACLQRLAHHGRVLSFEAPVQIGLMTGLIDISS